MQKNYKILVHPFFQEEQVERMKLLAPSVRFITEHPDALDDETLGTIDAVLGWSDKAAERFEALEKHRLTWVQTISAGVDSLNQEWMHKSCITLTNASGVHSESIAESVFGMLLGHERGIIRSVRAQEKRVWAKDIKPGLLHGQTMLIYGTGAIGKQIAMLAGLGFGMRTIGVNRSGREVRHFDRIVTLEQSAAVLGEADVVVGILPLTDESRHYFDRDFFRHMRDDAVFINAGRGPSVVTDDLVLALGEGRPAFAALDVTDPEPLPPEHALWAQENVLITPHISGSRPDYADRLTDIIVENLADFIETGKPTRNIIDYTRSY